MTRPEPGRRIYRRAGETATRLDADICVVGAGISGVSAALQAASLGRRVILVDGQPTLGGQAVNSLVGTFCGLYSNGPTPHRVTYGIADEMLAALRAADGLWPRAGRNTLIQLYDEVALARWIDRAIAAAGIEVILGAVLRRAGIADRRVGTLQLATRYGDVEIRAQGYVDTSGDAALAWTAGLAVQEADAAVWGSVMLALDAVDGAALAAIDRAAIQARMRQQAARYGLRRFDGFAFAVPRRDVALINMTHITTPLDAAGMARAQFAGRDQADRVHEFLRTEFPEAFARARVRSYGQPGIRQTRGIVGRHTLTAAEVRAGTMFDDAVARCSWPIELHDDEAAGHWEIFGDDHMHYVPLAAMTPPDVDNLVAAGRCIDAEPTALSSVRVMGPCIAMGMAAAHALDLAGSGSVHQIDRATLRARIAENLDAREPAPLPAADANA